MARASTSWVVAGVPVAGFMVTNTYYRKEKDCVCGRVNTECFGKKKRRDKILQHFSHTCYLDERAQVVLQAFLVTLGHDVYNHPESTRQCLAHVSATEGTRQRQGKCRRPSNRRQLTAISWASLVAAVRTSNSCISTVGRKLTMTWVSVAWRHCLNEEAKQRWR